MRYPYREEGFLTEMRSKMVNRQQLNEIALRMGLKKITLYNKSDGSLKISQIFGNTLEALVGAIYLDRGYKKTAKWVTERIIFPHMFIDDLELLEINHKNKLYGWANKNGKVLEFETIEERVENGRRLFTIAAVVDGNKIAEGKAFNKKDASQIAAQMAVAMLGLLNSIEAQDSEGEK
jgi:ribonuclease-3